MEKEGARQVAVVGKTDKREITVFFSVAVSGDMLGELPKEDRRMLHMIVKFP